MQHWSASCSTHRCSVFNWSLRSLADQTPPISQWERSALVKSF